MLAISWFTQYDYLAALLGAARNGLAARMLLTSLNERTPRTADEPDAERVTEAQGAVEAWNNAMFAARWRVLGEHDVLAQCDAKNHPHHCWGKQGPPVCPQPPADPPPPVMSLTGDARAELLAFSAGEAEAMFAEAVRDGDVITHEWWNRAAEHALRLSALCACVDWYSTDPAVEESPPRELTKDQVISGITLARWYGFSMRHEANRAGATEISIEAQRAVDTAARACAEVQAGVAGKAALAWAAGGQSVAMGKMIANRAIARKVRDKHEVYDLIASSGQMIEDSGRWYVHPALVARALDAMALEAE